MIAHYGRIHILVNLAGGLTRYKAAVDHTLDDWNAELNNNLLTAFLCSRVVFPTCVRAEAVASESGGASSSYLDNIFYQE